MHEMKVSTTCTLFGHREVNENIQEELRTQIIEIIKGWNVDTFLVGGDGKFDILAASVIREVKETYPDIKLVLVRPYMTKELKENMGTVKSLYDSIIMPTEAKNADYKRAIPIRNEWMVDHSLFVIAYLRREDGGAYKAVKYADRQGKILYKI